MKVKVGDTVKVIAGANKGKEGKVLKTYKQTNRVIIGGVNIVKKHEKPGRTNETGGILEIESAIHASNVKIIERGKNETKKKVEKAKETTALEKPKKTKKPKEKKTGDE